MKNQNIQNLFKLMLGTSALLVSVAFFIRTISPVHAISMEGDKLYVSPGSNVVDLSNAVGGPWVIGCGSGIYHVTSESTIGGTSYNCQKVGP